MRRVVLAMLTVLFATLPAAAATLVVEIPGGDKVKFVGAFQRWDADGNLVKKVNPKAKIDAPEVDATAVKSGGSQWIFKDIKPGKYDLVILDGERRRIEGWEYAPVQEFDPFIAPTATVADEEIRDQVAKEIRNAPHYENKVEPLYLGGDDKVVRALVMLIRDKETSYEGDFPGAATMRFEIWQFSYQYGGWAKEKRTRVMHRVILHRDELRKWTWAWDPKLGAIEVGKTNQPIKYALPSPTDKKLKGLYPY